MNGPPRLLTSGEVQELCRVSTATWNRWRAEGKTPPAVRIGRRYLYRPDDVDAWLDQQRTGGQRALS